MCKLNKGFIFSDQINSAEHYASGEPSHKILIHGLTTSVTESDVSI